MVNPLVGQYDVAAIVVVPRWGSKGVPYMFFCGAGKDCCGCGYCGWSRTIRRFKIIAAVVVTEVEVGPLGGSK